MNFNHAYFVLPWITITPPALACSPLKGKCGYFSNYFQIKPLKWEHSPGNVIYLNVEKGWNKWTRNNIAIQKMRNIHALLLYNTSASATIDTRIEKVYLQYLNCFSNITTANHVSVISIHQTVISCAIPNNRTLPINNLVIL